MRILALDSSGLVASVAILEEETLLAEYTINHKKTHSQTLLPMLDEIIRMTETDLSEIDAIAVAAGPGSFTGLRIGSATAKGLGLALNKPLVSVPTLEGLAANLWGCNEYICPMMDARRNQVYTGIYRFGERGLEVVEDQMACPVEKILEICRQRRENIVFLGDGVPVYQDMICSCHEKYDGGACVDICACPSESAEGRCSGKTGPGLPAPGTPGDGSRPCAHLSAKVSGGT